MKASNAIHQEIGGLNDELAKLLAAPTPKDLDAEGLEKHQLENRSGIALIQKRIEDAEGRREVALAMEERDQESRGREVQTPVADVLDAEVREIQKLSQRASMTRYLRYANAKAQMRGAEREYSQAVLGEEESSIQNDDGGPVIPPEFFLTTEERMGLHKRRMEMRASGLGDLTTADNTADSTMNEVLRRLFSATVADFLRVSPQSVGVGAHNYPTFATGASPNTISADVGKNTDLPEAATTITASQATPKRFGAQYRLNREDEALLQGVTDLHIQDLRTVLTQAVDHSILNKMFLRSSNPLVAAPTAAAASTATIATFQNLAIQNIDGVYAPSPTDVSFLFPEDTYKFAGGLRSSVTDLSAIEHMGSRGNATRASDKLPSAPGSGAFQGTNNIMVVRANGEGAVAPVWGGVNLVVDRVTGVRKGQILITIYMMMDVIVRRGSVYKQVNVKIT